MCICLAVMVSHDTLFCDISFNSSIVLAFGLCAPRSICCPILLYSAFQIVDPCPLAIGHQWEMGGQEKGKPEHLSFPLCLGQHCWQWPRPLHGSPTHRVGPHGSSFCWVTLALGLQQPYLLPLSFQPAGGSSFLLLLISEFLPCPLGKASDSNTKTRPKKKKMRE